MSKNDTQQTDYNFNEIVSDLPDEVMFSKKTVLLGDNDDDDFHGCDDCTDIEDTIEDTIEDIGETAILAENDETKVVRPLKANPSIEELLDNR